MTNTNARTAANVLLASAGLAVAYVVVTRPPLRRLAFRMAWLWLGAYVPAYLAEQVRHAWLDAGRAGNHQGAPRGASQSAERGDRTWRAENRTN